MIVYIVHGVQETEYSGSSNAIRSKVYGVFGSHEEAMQTHKEVGVYVTRLEAFELPVAPTTNHETA